MDYWIKHSASERQRALRPGGAGLLSKYIRHDSIQSLAADAQTKVVIASDALDEPTRKLREDQIDL